MSVDELRPFRHRRTVRFGDVDPAGMVYYPRLLHYIHVAMEAFFAELVGVGYADFVREHGLGLPTVSIDAEFHRPVRFGDEIEIETAVESLGRTSIVWTYRVLHPPETEPAAEARLVTVNMDMQTQEKREIPDWLRSALT
ncbi:MAG: acyl-CoA thioesterase [Thermoanaerobaculia bacterium]